MFSLPRCAVLALILLTATACQNKNTPGPGSESAVALPEDGVSSPAISAGHKSVAEKVVSQSAGVKEGDLVLIFGSDEDLPLLEDIAVEVRKRGASPLVSVATEQLDRRLYDEVPAKYDSHEPEMMAKLAGIVDVIINTEAGEGRTLEGVPAERIAARATAFAPTGALMQKRGVRTVGLGNGLYPSAERAEQFGISREELAEMMYGGVDANYEALAATGKQLKAALDAGTELHLTNPNGTDLKVRIAGRPVTVNDGVISDEDRKKGGAATSVWLPAGEVYVTPVPGTAKGTVVVDRFFFQGKPITGLRLEFAGGKLTSMGAKEGIEPLKAAFDAAGPGKDILGVVDLGINSGIKSPDGSPVHVWAKAGTVTVSMGNNTWAGGDNRTNFGVAVYSPGTTVMVDGKPLIQDGKIVTAERTASR